MKASRRDFLKAGLAGAALAALPRGLWDDPPDGSTPAPDLIPFLADDRGYATGMAGQWHLGFRPALPPKARGVGEFFGFHGGAQDHLPHESALRASLRRGTEPVVDREPAMPAFDQEAAQ